MCSLPSPCHLLAKLSSSQVSTRNPWTLSIVHAMKNRIIRVERGITWHIAPPSTFHCLYYTSSLLFDFLVPSQENPTSLSYYCPLNSTGKWRGCVCVRVHAHTRAHIHVHTLNICIHTTNNKQKLKERNRRYFKWEPQCIYFPTKRKSSLIF